MQASQETLKPFPVYKRALTSSLISVVPTTSHFFSWSYEFADVVLGVSTVIGACVLTNLSALLGRAGGFLALRVSIKNLLLILFFAVVWSDWSLKLDLEILAKTIPAVWK